MKNQNINSIQIQEQKALNKKIKEFERKNPQIVGAMKIFELGMSEYQKALNSLEPVKTYTSNSTMAKAA